MNDTSFDPTLRTVRATVLREGFLGETYNPGNGRKMGTTKQVKMIRKAENLQDRGLCRLLPV